MTVNQISSTMQWNLTDNTGRKAIHVALPQQRVEIENRLLLCGRYRINPGPVVHRSKTCEVVFAIDVKDTSQSNDGRAVAIKIMKDRNQWECEIRARQKYKLNSCVVKLLGWHVPKDEATISGDDLHPEPTDTRSKYKYLLILERGEISGHRAVETKQPPLRVTKKKVKVRVPSKFLKHSKEGTVKKNYKIRVPSKLLKKKKSGNLLVKKKLKVRVPSKFFKPITEKKSIATTSKKKLKVRVPSKFLKRAVKKQIVQKKKRKSKILKQKVKIKVKPKGDNKTAPSSALTKLRRFVRAKRQVKVHPIVTADDE